MVHLRSAGCENSTRKLTLPRLDRKARSRAAGPLLVMSLSVSSGRLARKFGQPAPLPVLRASNVPSFPIPAAVVTFAGLICTYRTVFKK